jgi:CelD/BcsL family acetyltransferase involved in cellulose biosynthesis
MLWPLVAQRVGGLKVLHWMGAPASQYGDVLAEDLPDKPELMRQAWRFITTRLGADALFLRKVRADATAAPLLRELEVLQTAGAEAPYLDLASARDFGSYEQRYTAKARKNRRRLSRRLAEQGPLVVERHVGGAEARAAALQAIELKRKWIEKTGRVSAAFADERFAAFFADAAEGRYGRPVGCGVTVLKSNGAPAGIAIDITCNKHRAAHVIVHDPSLDSFSAGTLLFETWIKGASADGMATFDLLAPAYAYKLDWADGTVAVGDYAQGLTLAGRAYVGIYLGRARATLKAVVEAWPEIVARLRALRELAWRAHRAQAEG